MTTGEIRRAAALMRQQHGPDHPRHRFWNAVANWLDDVAEAMEDEAAEHTVTTYESEHALAVARAYPDGQ